MNKSLSWRRRFRFHLFGVIEGHTKLYSLIRTNEGYKGMGRRQRTRKISRSSSSVISIYSMQTICLLENIRLYFGGSCFPGFPAFCLYQYFLLLSL